MMFGIGFPAPHAQFGADRLGKLDEYWSTSGHGVATAAVTLPSNTNMDHVASRPSAHCMSFNESGRLIAKLKSACRLPRSGFGPQPSAPQLLAPWPGHTVPIAKLDFIDMCCHLVQIHNSTKRVRPHISGSNIKQCFGEAEPQ
jgi:hypothetical protein